MIAIEKLSLSKGKTVILKNIDLSITQGDVVLLAGRNGAGKTTLLKCLLGIEKNYTGQIVFHTDSGRSIGYVPDNPALYDHLSAYDNLNIIRLYHDQPAAAVGEQLAKAGLGQDAHTKVKYFSAGMKKKLSIAAALICRPQLLILDEPTNALDPEAVIELREHIARLSREEKVTFLIATHLLEEINKIANQLVLLKKGVVVFNEPRSAYSQYKVIKGMIADNTKDELVAFLASHQLKTKSDDHLTEILLPPTLTDDGKLSSLLTDIAIRDASIEDLFTFNHVG
ncbi:ABC transporter ATP-binding protein [Rhodoflexus sp.]